MKVSINGHAYPARLTTDHTASCYGVPILLIGGDAFGPADVAGLVLISATAEEKAALERAGYYLDEEIGHAAQNKD